MAKNSVLLGILFLAGILILIGFGVWPVAAAMLLLTAGLILHVSDDIDNFGKLEARISVVQATVGESVEKICRSINEMSDSITFLRSELGRVSGSLEARMSALERPRNEETQKYYDLIQKIIDIENRVSSMHKTQEQIVGEN